MKRKTDSGIVGTIDDLSEFKVQNHLKPGIWNGIAR